MQQKKYYDIRHSRNFKFAKNDTVIKFLPRNSQRKVGKLDDKFTGPYIIDKITDLGIARLRTPKGKILKKGVPIKQLQKYNKPDDDDNYSNTSNEIEKEEQPKKRGRIFIDSESSNSDVDVMTVSPSPHVNHKCSITDRKTEEKQEVGPSVKQPVTFTKNNEARPSVKQPVTFMKNNKARPSVKQHVTPKTLNIQDSFRSTQSMKSPISQIKGGVKKLETQTRKLFFPSFTESIDKTTTEIEMCDTLPDIPDVNETELDVELCDTVDTLPDLPNEDTVQTNRQETKSSQSEIQETGFDEGDPVLFFPITNSTRRNIAPYFSLMVVNSVMRQMPNYRMGGTARGLKPPDKVFVIRGDGNCYFRALSFILTGTEIYHIQIQQAICDFIEIHYDNLNIFLDQFVEMEDTI